jgi:hypothetical protein
VSFDGNHARIEFKLKPTYKLEMEIDFKINLILRINKILK